MKKSKKSAAEKTSSKLPGNKVKNNSGSKEVSNNSFAGDTVKSATADNNSLHSTQSQYPISWEYIC